MTDTEDIYISAFRYALGRRSYITGFMADQLIQLCRSGGLSKHARNLIVREIDEHTQIIGNLGRECDKRAWEGLQEYLRNYKEGG